MKSQVKSKNTFKSRSICNGVEEAKLVELDKEGGSAEGCNEMVDDPRWLPGNHLHGGGGGFNIVT